eukprot:CAMPEP_0117443644 /NCGR_PEP_ID=MMETSP0759-20121206/4805_1 /TAXON_ID=63605 /ORGANISM="Percolomonas cosmopolitus, Strain WS" /LENGTH=306 /DNA_ID=CAMNT_0005235633 /DNA_START=58 /DNA_END=978 /DNA_ORIENTATION=+
MHLFAFEVVEDSGSLWLPTTRLTLSFHSALISAHASSDLSQFSQLEIIVHRVPQGIPYRIEPLTHTTLICTILASAGSPLKFDDVLCLFAFLQIRSFPPSAHHLPRYTMSFLSPVPNHGGNASTNMDSNDSFLLFKQHHFNTLSNCKLVKSWNGTYKGMPGIYLWRKSRSVAPLDQLVFMPHRPDVDTVVLKSIPTALKSLSFSRKVDKYRRNTEIPVDRVLQHTNAVKSNGWMEASPISPPVIESPVTVPSSGSGKGGVTRGSSSSQRQSNVHSLYENHQMLSAKTPNGQGYLSQNDDEDIFALF